MRYVTPSTDSLFQFNSSLSVQPCSILYRFCAHFDTLLLVTIVTLLTLSESYATQPQLCLTSLDSHFALLHTLLPSY